MVVDRMGNSEMRKRKGKEGASMQTCLSTMDYGRRTNGMVTEFGKIPMGIKKKGSGIKGNLYGELYVKHENDIK